MKIQYMSDLHLEVNPGFRAVAATAADVLVLAGDIGSYQANSALLGESGPLGREDWGLSRFSPLPGFSPWYPDGWPTPVIYVPGNHEFDGLDWRATRDRLREVCAALGIVCLDDAVHHIGPVRFLGSTLWADFDALAAERSYKPRSFSSFETRRFTLRQKAFRAADHYLERFHCTRDGVPLLAQELRELSLASQAWVTEELRKPHPAGQTGKTVAITHFAPSLKSHDPRYGIQPGTAGFCNAMDELIPLADAWIHGHLHAPSAYQVGNCAVRANPLGYANTHEQKGFSPWATVEV